MARPEVLDRIQAAEREAEEIRDSAREEADALESERLDAAREEIEAEREAILESGAQEREQLESHARENTDDVAEYVVAEFIERVHA